MQGPLFRFTLGQLIKLIAVLAMFFALLRTPAWPLILAIVPIIPGFALDWSKGGPGLLGSMLAGAIGGLGLGIVILVYSHLFDGSSSGVADLFWLLGGAAYLSLMGLAWGVCVGTWLFVIALLLGLRPGAKSSPVEPIARIIPHRFEDRGLQHPQVRGHQP
jgi:hypothetical protein